VRFLIHPEVKAQAPRALAWVKGFLGRFDTSAVGWLRIDFGREYRDRLGRRYHKYRGVYGRCWYPTERQPTVRISCQVPGPFPCEIVTRQRPVYRNPDGSWPPEARGLRGPVFVDARTGRAWKRVYAATRVADLDEAVVWIFAHEAFHWLCRTRQMPGRNTEAAADAFADRCLREFRQSPPVACQCVGIGWVAERSICRAHVPNSTWFVKSAPCNSHRPSVTLVPGRLRLVEGAPKVRSSSVTTRRH
jgi:hypothetical protein